MTESIQHNEKARPGVNSQTPFHRTLIRWPKGLWAQINAVAADQEMDFGAFVRLATRRQLERLRRDEAV